MTTPITIAYPCPDCGAEQAILPQKIEAISLVRCAQCDRPHGRLDEVQRQLSDQAREEGSRRAQQIYRTRPTIQNSASGKKDTSGPAD
jgi:hypothetical protein